ncbi:hypothetical protein A6A04_12490 [Paramagnetospirillum marisnigri]|uniref:Photoactive yellow protein n=2 Tax=Paramagnetospirillum marisnigri TaxID=1285242 RepID=A0A178MV20_9PROT|nr:hypothetical protein A6A04_12490 [Paramagnetospirillum marisnigri]
MTVYTFEMEDADNPLGRLTEQGLAELPFGAVELSSEGMVVGYNDTEPSGAAGLRQSVNGRHFFKDVAPWAGSSMVADEFRKGVESGDLNVVFDCAVPGQTYKVRVHLKVSPILGTFWVFIKRLRRQAA